MAEKDIVERLRQTAHDFELHDPQRGVTYTGRCDVEAIREAADLIDCLRSPSAWRDISTAPVQWTCGHTAGAHCAQCYTELAAKAHELQMEVYRLREELESKK